jgi:hypothetical protein
MSGLGTGPTQQPLLQPAMPLGFEARNGLAITGTGLRAISCDAAETSRVRCYWSHVIGEEKCQCGIVQEIGRKSHRDYPGGCRSSSAARFGGNSISIEPINEKQPQKPPSENTSNLPFSSGGVTRTTLAVLSVWFLCNSPE